MNFYAFHIGDYASRTRHLTWTEDAAYRRMLDVYYVTEAPLPLDERALFRLVLAASEEQREAVRAVLSEFFHRTEQGWQHDRCDAEIAGKRDAQQRARDKANARWAKERGNAAADAAAMQQHAEDDAAACEVACSGNAPTPTPTPTPTPKEKDKAARAARFDAIASLVAAGCPEGVARDFLAVRRAKRAPLTAAALDALVREAGKARMSLEAVLRECCARGWQAFKAEWMLGLPMQQPRADVARVTVPSTPGIDPALRKIQEDERRAAPMPPEVRAQLARLKPGTQGALPC